MQIETTGGLTVSDELRAIINSFGARHVAVVGDVMLDRYFYGAVSRISPEAPISVLTISEEIAVPGGAANVARNVVSLGGRATLIGYRGRDRAGINLSASLARMRLWMSG